MPKGETFSVGDIVQLLSGGPKMTVTNPSNFEGRVACQWFSGSKLSHGDFEPSTLKRADDAPAKG